jgi:hypothetical protein
MCLDASACPVNQAGGCGDINLTGDVGTLDWLHWVGQDAATKSGGSGLIQCACNPNVCPCTTTGALSYDTSPTSFSWSDGTGSLKTGVKDLHGISYRSLLNYVTIPPSSGDIAVRVYAGVSNNSPVQFSAILKDHTGAELATTTYSYMPKSALYVDVVWIVTVPPPSQQEGGDTRAAQPRTLQLTWDGGGAQLQAVAVSHNTTGSKGGGWAEARVGRVAAAVPPPPFVILQAAAVSQ